MKTVAQQLRGHPEPRRQRQSGSDRGTSHWSNAL